MTVANDHGRLEIRRHSVCHGIDRLFSDRRYTGEVKFPGLAMIGMIASETTRGGKIETARRYYLCSTKLSAAAFANVVRAHWGIENRLTSAKCCAAPADHLRAIPLAVCRVIERTAPIRG